jgi:gliding motility-associated-like protein
LQIEKEGCTTSDTIQIFGDPVPFDLGNDTTICKGEELNLILPAEATYIWQDGRQGFEYQISQAGIYWVESQTGCKLRDSIQVHVLELKADIISTDSVICNGEPVLLAIDDPDISYNWNTGSQEYYIIAQSPGLYSVIIEKVGCTAVDSIWISESNFTLDLGRDTSLCSEDVLVLDTSIPDASYLWQDGSISPTLEVNQSGTYWVDVNLNGCIVRDSILIEKNTFFIDLGKDSIICQGENVLLDVSIPGASYQWDDGSNLPAMTIDQAGTYWVDVSLNGCIQSDTIEIIVNNVEVNLGEDLLVCDGEYVEIDASVSEATFLWQDGSTEATMYTDLPGTYWVEVIKDGCIDSDTIRIEQVVFNLNLGRDTILCPGDEVLLIASVENATYLWQDGSTLSTFNATQPGMYWVDINVDGCVKTDIIEIQNSELCGDSNVFIPNAFSPNRDGVNDEFKVFSKSELLEFSLMIFDRWGNTVFDTNNQEYYWDGKWNGKASATGVYVVFLSFKDPENVNPITITNTLTLIR